MAVAEAIDQESFQQKRRSTTRIVRLIGLCFMVLSIISISVTYVVLTGLSSIEPNAEINQLFIIVNSILIAGLIGSIGWEVKNLIGARSRARAAARLHVRIITLFGIIAAIPAIIVTILAALTLDRGLDRWFETRVSQIVENALTVAEAYVGEHSRVLMADLLAMAGDIDRASSVYTHEPSRFDNFFDTQARIRSVNAAYLMNRDGRIVVRTKIQGASNFPPPPESAFAEADNRTPAMIQPGAQNLIGGLVKLNSYENLYLYAVRLIDAQVIEYLRTAQVSEQEFSQLEGSQFGVQVAFALIFIGVSLVILLAATWLGFGFARQLVAPIRNLISAASQVSGGNLNVEVPTNRELGDLADLGTSFNTMTSELRVQRDALLSANQQIDSRRRFTETVLAGVTSGVIGIDQKGKITLLNRFALQLLQVEEESLINKQITTTIPELSEFISEALKSHSAGPWQSQIILKGSDRRERTISVRLTTDESNRKEYGFVLTMDDITDLITAQRNSAWADVARRVAHEIKNPLTPIQLSAERIRRKFGKNIDLDKSIFDRCIDTIVRQVSEIGRMVDEFSTFARMPKARIAKNNLTDIVQQCTFMQSVANSEIKFETHFPEENTFAWFDHRLVGQAVTNVIKNASESVMSAKAADGRDGLVKVTLINNADSIIIEVMDNGTGLPIEDRNKIFEPYITTRSKGTGLGLSIVRKIMDEHGGNIELFDVPESEGGKGAIVRLTFKANEIIVGKEENDISETNESELEPEVFPQFDTGLVQSNDNESVISNPFNNNKSTEIN